MKIVMTLMVRDEADIVGAMLEHHFAQGVDHVIVTDNASVDGTTEILEAYAARGLISLYHDPRHEKQQSVVVTRMAREAATAHGATWVLNADADEFWVAERPGMTLREALAEIPTAYQAFNVPVIDMIGDPAQEGSGVGRLTYRDQRSVAQINAFGLHAHATHDVAHIGDPDVEVVQGNHFVNIESQGGPELGAGIEVLHLPWRSWKQFRTKVENAGKAYERSGLTPSPNHHGMRDYRRLRAGTLFALYLARHPSDSDRRDDTGLVEDRRLADTLASPVPDIPVSVSEWEALASLAGPIIAAEREIIDLRSALEATRGESEQRAQQLRSWDEEIQKNHAEITKLHAEIAVYRESRLLKAANALSRWMPRDRT